MALPILAIVGVVAVLGLFFAKDALEDLLS